MRALTRSQMIRAIYALSLIVYLGWLYKYLLTPTIPSFGHRRPYNFVPFKTIAENLSDSGTPLKHRMIQLFGNLSVMAPVGLYLILFKSRRKILHTFLFSLCMSLGVEAYQYLAWTWRVADIDDVLCNSGGAVFVIWLYTLNEGRIARISTLANPASH